MYQVLAFHAEKLHDDRVWYLAERIARWMTSRGLRATWFVYPFRAQVAGKEITNRVRALAALGHEIGQHTHFYAGTKIDKPDKVTDLSEANIRYCLNRDFETLHMMGIQPRGFTAGAWAVNETVLDTLINLGFVYDCSARFPKRKETVSPCNSWLRSPRTYANARGRIVCLPTTCALGEWYKWGRRIWIESTVPYQLVYLHDYDLLCFRKYLLLRWFLVALKERNFTPAGILAQQFFNAEGDIDGSHNR